MRQYFTNASRLLSKMLPLLAVCLIILVAWRVVQIIYAPNLLSNPGFDSEGTARWQLISQGNGQATTKVLEDNPDNNALQLDIPDSSIESWAGVGQSIPAEPERRYKVSLNYRLTSGDSSPSKVILRVVQLDEAGNPIKTDDISNLEPLIVASTDGGQAPWQTLSHSFVTDKRTTSVEIGSGLIGQQATTIEIDNIILQAYSARLSALGQNILILILSILLIVGINQKWQIGRTYTKSVLRPVILVVVNIIILFIFAELVALGIYFVRTGDFFYTNKKTYLLLEMEGDQDITRHRIHPYFGYTLRTYWHRELIHDTGEDLSATTNNQGFFSDYDYPFTKSNKNQYIIGIFGGSVAEEFYILNRNKLVENLQQDDFFADKEIVVLNFAKAGYKQPQQLLVLAYFLSTEQELDMAINIDGLNEITGANRNNDQRVDITMPHAGVVQSLVNLTNRTTLTSEKLQSFAKIDRYRTQLNNLAQTINNSNLASVNFILGQYYQYIFGKYNLEITRSEALQSDYSQASLFFIKPSEAVLEDSVLFERAANGWANDSVMMNQLINGRNGLYYDFVQPNQYYSSKVFTDYELEYAINPTHINKAPSEKGYPYLIAKFDFLKENVAGFYDATHIFDDVTESTYRDDCCHHTQLGYDIMTDFITDSILKSENLRNQKEQIGR